MLGSLRKVLENSAEFVNDLWCVFLSVILWLRGGYLKCVGDRGLKKNKQVMEAGF